MYSMQVSSARTGARLLAVAVLLLFAAGTASAASVSVNPTSPSVDEEETVDIVIDMETSKEIYGAQFTFEFDPELLKAIELEKGGFLGEDTILPVEKIDNENGTVDPNLAGYPVGFG